MLPRSGCRHAQRALRQACQQPLSRRGLADQASGSYGYQVGEAQGIRFASRDIPGPVGTLAVVSQAGTRFQTLPGLAEAMRYYAFKVGWQSLNGIAESC